MCPKKAALPLSSSSTWTDPQGDYARTPSAYHRIGCFPGQGSDARQAELRLCDPPNKDMSILHGVLHLFTPTALRGLRLPIDFFCAL